MLEFFHRYQRFFFIFVTFLVISSFLFFGTYDALSGSGGKREAEDRVLGQLVDGSALKLSDVHRMSKFLATDRNDGMLSSHVIPNYCNDGVIRNDLLNTGLSDMLVVSYFDALKEDFRQRLDRAKRFRGYVHPDAPFLSSRSVWDRFMPSIGQELDALTAQEEASPAVFTHLSKLYRQQMVCPPEFVRRVLMYFHREASWVKVDPALNYTDLSLFGYHTIGDWFGPNFIDLASEFILNSAKMAEKKGIVVSLEEAKADLYRNFEESMKKLAEMKQSPDGSLSQHLRTLGFDEKEAVDTWRSVLLFRRYFQGVGNATFIDSLAIKDFAMFSKETFLVQKYEWPEALHLKTFSDLVEFQTYLQMVSDVKRDSLSLPASFSSIEKIGKLAPELVQAEYRVKMSQVALEEVGLRASMQEIFQWQLEESNWNALSQSFPFLKGPNTKDERFVCIENLSREQRSRVDLFTRKELAKMNPQWVDELLAASHPVETVVSLSEVSSSLPGIENVLEFSCALDAASQGDASAKERLGKYKAGESSFFRFDSVEKIADRHVLTFEEARKLGVMTAIADRILEDEYKKLRAQMPSRFQVKEGEWKLFSSVKEEVASLVYANLLQKMSKESKPLAYYAAHRLEVPANEAKLALQKNLEDSKWISQGNDPLADQFKFLKKETPIQRTTKDEWMKEQVFVMVPNDWSPVRVPEDGNITFFFFEKKKPNEEPILEQIAFGKEVIAGDAKRYVAEGVLLHIKQKNAIVVPIQKD